jgi:hypothetical protein
MAGNVQHLLINVSAVLEAIPPAAAGFGTTAFFTKDLTGFITATDRYRVYSTNTEAQADADLNAAAKAAAIIAFSQSPTPSSFMVVNVDAAAASEDYDDAFNDLMAVNPAGFYGVTIESRVDADILTMGAAIVGLNKLFCFQTDDASALLGATAGFAAGHATLEDQENVIPIWHVSDLEYADVGYLVARTVFDPDRKSAGWQGNLVGVAAYADGTINSTQRAAALANGYNLILGFGSSNTYVSPGKNAAGRQINQIVSVHWFVTRLIEDLQGLKQVYDSLGDKIPLSPEGQAIVGSVMYKRFELGVGAGHFWPSNQGGLDLAFPDEITVGDEAAGILRTERFRVRLLNNALSFDVALQFSNSSVTVEVI